MTETIMHTLLLVESFRRKVGRPIHPSIEDVEITAATQTVYEGPFVLLSHTPDRKYNYANKAAQNLWGYTWEEFIGMESSKSAQPDDTQEQSQRDALLAKAEEQGYIDNYSGVRIRKDGTKFRVSGLTLWNVESPSGTFLGQAAVFDTFEELDGSAGCILPGGLVQVEGLPAADDDNKDNNDLGDIDVVDLEKEIHAQGDKIRGLKDSGLSNKDTQVQEAVAVLIALKEKLQAASQQ